MTQKVSRTKYTSNNNYLKYCESHITWTLQSWSIPQLFQVLRVISLRVKDVHTKDFCTAKSFKEIDRRDVHVFPFFTLHVSFISFIPMENIKDSGRWRKVPAKGKYDCAWWVAALLELLPLFNLFLSAAVKRYELSQLCDSTGHCIPWTMVQSSPRTLMRFPLFSSYDGLCLITSVPAQQPGTKDENCNDNFPPWSPLDSSVAKF